MSTRRNVPADWAEITPEWMTAALAGHHPGARVSDVNLVLRDDGTNRRARFELRFAAGSGPGRVFLKAEGEHRLVHNRNGNLFNEADLYASQVLLPLDHPLVYRVLVDRPSLDWMLVMEDVTLRDGDPRDATRPMTVDQVAAGLRGLARLHGRYWGFDATTEPALAWVRTWASTEGFAGGLRSRIPTGLDRADGQLPADVAGRGTDGVVELWSRYVDTLGRETPTLLHADAHIGNTYVLPGDEVGFLDWQVVRRGGWSQDVGYFLVGALTTADRQAHETDLLRHYLDALDLPAGARPTWDVAWRRYRACAAYGLAIWLSTLGTDGWQRPEVSLTLARRYATAFSDLEAATAVEP
ncbi:protein of unknown function (DUF227) [Frankia sp. EI5c]|uniref:oxidoreductase family protein n=1 Tax=Frankia sp. EI5c TaxID=683316 RepID=UPI0007C29EAD|nr:oxidoreductase family protein [Frankia sp. EI5c]OAA21789.1 protein of unknown function (DUF227) [Frankia sp. EI5c]